MNEMAGIGRRGLSGSAIKLIGIIAMFIDHFAAAVLYRVIIARIMYSQDRDALTQWLTQFMRFLRMIGRLSFPIFCFMLVEGFEKTGNKAKYAIRLGLFALISEIPFDLVFNARVLEFKHQNVFFTLFLGFFVLCAYEFIGRHQPPVVVRWLMGAMALVFLGVWLTTRWHMQMTLVVICCAAGLAGLILYGWKKGVDSALTVGEDLMVLLLCMIAAGLLKTDYSSMGVLTISVIYVLRFHKVLAMFGGCVVLAILGRTELPAFLALIPIAMYNGERGLKLKYFFYAAYPGHLLIIWLIALWMGLNGIAVF